MTERNVFVYWTGKTYSLINILHTLIKLHSRSGRGYTLHYIDETNLREYIPDLPSYFHTLLPAHQADYVRIHVVCEYGGIWLDSDTIVMSNLDALFELLELYDGFFITEYDACCNGVFGSRRRTPFMLEWKRRATQILQSKRNKIGWIEIGSHLINEILKHAEFNTYYILKGRDTVYPVFYDQAVEQYIRRPYKHYKNIIRPFQPLIILVNAVYRELQHHSELELLNGTLPLNYFLMKAFDQLEFKNYDFIEIGTSNFNTLIEHADDTTVGLSIEPIKSYLDQLPERKYVKKLNLAISDQNTIADIYYIPEEIIFRYDLPEYLKGCSRLNEYHPLIKPYTHLCMREKVRVLSIAELFFRERVKQVQLLKIDTEGHDCIILQTLYSYLRNMPSEYYPRQILFETNENTASSIVDQTLELFFSMGYQLQYRGYDTLITYKQ